MNSQVKKPSKKTKTSPNQSEIEAQFYATQRVKTSRAAKPSKIFKSQEDKEIYESLPNFSKESIPYIDKQIFIENSLDMKDTAPTTSDTRGDCEEVNNTCIESKNGREDKEKAIDITTILSDKYIPKKHLLREKESQEILSFILRCVKNDSYDTLLLSGMPGTGKTTVLRYVLKKLEENGLRCINQFESIEYDIDWACCPDEVSIINVDTSLSDSISNTVLEIIKAMDGKIPLSIAAYKNNSKILIDKLKQMLLAKKNKKPIVVAFDEIEKLFSKPTTVKEVAELLRVPRYPFSGLIFIAVTNIPDFLTRLFELYKVNLDLTQIIFEPYSTSSMSSILQSRFELAGPPLDSHIINENVFEQVNLTSCIQQMTLLKDTDIRQALRILRRAYAKKNPVPVLNEEESKTDTSLSQSQITDEDVIKAYEELYDDQLSGMTASMSQKHLMGLAALIMLLNKKGSDTFTKRDLLNMYNNICGRLFLPKADLTGLAEVLNLYEAYKIIELKPKEQDAAATGKKSPVKTPLKNEEYTALVAPERIKLALQQDGFFSKFFEE